MSDEDRFNRIEQKLDGITQILATQAAHDERITALTAREQRSEERLDNLEFDVQNNSTITRGRDRGGGHPQILGLHLLLFKAQFVGALFVRFVPSYLFPVTINYFQ